ncbi:MAG TPA: dihydrolipoyl dehydrogenase [Burkholderiaceae bacterium]|jgi:dihydrolipoamide dehydrogenase|nr:dihydrolipoyl dehydrogenase [Burkholderiaceae bacterium]
MATGNQFDVVVIGAGPGGYTGAIRAAQLGLRVACVDSWRNDKGGPAPGGTCTNIGCIPSKALLHSSEHFDNARRHFGDHGIRIESIAIDVEKMLARKATVVRQNNEGILYLFKKNGVTFFNATARFEARDAGGYRVGLLGTDTVLSAPNVVVATGSVARPLPGVAFDEERVLSNDGALAIPQVPRRLGVIGAGVVGLELGSVWRRLGAEVTLLEALPEFLPAADGQIAREALKQMTRQGLKIQLGVNIQGVDRDAETVKVRYLDSNQAAQALEFDRLIVSIGRLPYTEGLNAEAVGLKLDERGFVEVDAGCRTGVAGLWAIGDVVRGPMLAHKAEEEAVAVAETIAGQHGHVDMETIPWVIYTAPEIAWVGRTEQQLKAAGQAYRAGTFPFSANGRARAMGDTVGLVKFLADAQTDRVLGVHVIGPMASELIAEAVLAMAFQASSEDIARVCHAHPTLSEATREAALAVEGRALNF